MAVIARFLGIIIKMFYNEHNPPHFHVEYGEYYAVVYILTLDIKGKLPNKVRKKVLNWTELHRHELINNWERSMNKDEFIYIGE